MQIVQFDIADQDGHLKVSEKNSLIAGSCKRILRKLNMAFGLQNVLAVNALILVSAIVEPDQILQGLIDHMRSDRARCTTSKGA